MYLKFSIKNKFENLPQNKHIGSMGIIWVWILSMQATWIKVIKTKDWTPKEPTLLSFIAFKRFFLPAKIPSNVSIKPSRCRPPVIKYPDAKQINVDAKMDQEFAFRKIKI